VKYQFVVALLDAVVTCIVLAIDSAIIVVGVGTVGVIFIAIVIGDFIVADVASITDF
jgi:hypothetical protein